MKSYIIKTAREIVEEEVEQALKSDESSVKLKVTMLGLSASDKSIYDGRTPRLYPIIPCRIAVALVSESSSPNYLKGERFLISPYSVKGNTFTTRGVDCAGLAGDYVICTDNDLKQLPDNVSDIEAIFVEDIAACIRTLVELKLDKRDYIVLKSASYLNCIIAQLAMYYQAIPIVIDNDEERLARASKCGVYYTYNSTQENVLQRVMELTGGKLAEHTVVDCDCVTGGEDFIGYVGNNGKIALIGFSKEQNEVNIDCRKCLKNQLTIMAVSNGYGEIETAINLLANKVISVEPLIGAVNTASDAAELTNAFKSLSNVPPYLKSAVKVH